MTAITTRSIDVQSCSLSINGVDVSDNVIKVTFPSSWINNDVTAFGSVGRRYNAGIDETKFTVEMMFNQVATTGTIRVSQSACFRSCSGCVRPAGCDVPK